MGGTPARTALALALGLTASACAPNDEGGDAGPEVPHAAPFEGLYAVRLHEVATPDCDADPVPVAEADLDDDTRSPPYLIVGPELGPGGSLQLVALACEADMTCEVRIGEEFRVYYDIDGAWQFIERYGKPNDEDGCDIGSRVETLNVTGRNAAELEMLTEITSDTVSQTCRSAVPAIDPDELPCTRWERVVAERIDPDDLEPLDDAGTEPDAGLDAGTDAEP